MAEQRPMERDGNADTARLLLAAARERFSVAATDLLLPEQSRLTEWQRITASALLVRLVRTVEDDLRIRLSRHFQANEAVHAAFSSAHVQIALPLLERSQALRDSDLGTVLVRRVEEHRYWKASTATGSADEYLIQLVRDPDQAVAAEAMSLLIARSRRFDQFQDPVMGHTELPAELQHRLVWMVAAALRHYLTQQHRIPPGEADAAISAAATGLIAGYDESQGMEACSVRLARLLGQAKRLEDATLARMLEEGLLPLFIAGIAFRASLEYAAAWEVLSDPRGRGPAFLLRAASVERGHAASILLILNRRGQMFSGPEGDAAAAQLDLFDVTDEASSKSVLRLWQADPGYRAAVARLSTRSRAAPEAA